MRSRPIALLLAVLLLGVAGAQEMPAPAGNPTPQEPAEPSPDAPPESSGLPTVAPSEPLPPGVLIRIAGVDVSEADYAKYLTRVTGMGEFFDFVDDILLRKKAAELGVAVSDQEVAAAVDKEVNVAIERMAGDRGRYLASLAKKFYTLESWKQYRSELLRPRLLLDACILKTRVVADDEVREKFEELYGVGGVTTQVRQIMISNKREVPSGTPLELAKELLKKLEADRDSFVQLVEEYSDHTPSKRNDGLILNYRPGRKNKPGYLSAAFDSAVANLKTEGEVAGPIESEAGYHIVQLVRRTTTQFEEKAAELRALLEKQTPTVLEKNRFRKKLRQETKLEK